MVSVPAIEFAVFFLLLRKPASKKIEDQHRGDNVAEEDNAPRMRSFKEKIMFIESLVRHMVPLGLVYFFEYFINQGMSLCSFKNLISN